MTDHNADSPEETEQMDVERELEGAREFLMRAKRADNAAQGVDREYYSYYRQKAHTNRKIAREIVTELDRDV